MSDDFRLSTSFFGHPKIVKLRRRLGDHGIVSLLRLYSFVTGNRPDGDLTGMSDEDIEIAAAFEGAPGVLVRELFDLRLLDGQSWTYRVHDWVEHNPWVANRGQRIDKARRAAEARWNQKSDEMLGAKEISAPSIPDSSSLHAQSMPQASISDALHPTPLLQTQPTENQTPSSEQSCDAEPTRTGNVTTAVGRRLSALLKSEILRNKPDFKITQAQERKWALSADRMIRLDGRSEEQIAEVITWAQRDEFWRANVLSMDKLRDKFDQLSMKRQSGGRNGKNDHNSGAFRSGARYDDVKPDLIIDDDNVHRV